MQPLESYILEGNKNESVLFDYGTAPAKALLRYIMEVRKSYKEVYGKYDLNVRREGQADSSSHIGCALLGAAMGHFETYQRSLFAGLLDLADSLPTFNSSKFLRQIKKECGFEVTISPERLLAHRGTDITCGIVFADALGGWHNPQRVNSYFSALGVRPLFSNNDLSDIEVLWQLRHSIVHSASSIRVQDAAKVSRLWKFRGKQIILDHGFFDTMSLRISEIVLAANGRLSENCKSLIGNDAHPFISTLFEDFFKVD